MTMGTRVIPIDGRRTVWLYRDGHPRAEVYFRGGICWPFTESRGQRFTTQGAAVLCGLDVESGVVRLHEWRVFQAVRHLIAADGTLTREGLVSLFADSWARYYARHWYCHDEGAMESVFRQQVAREKSLIPRPVLVPTAWPTSDNVPAQMIHAYVSDGRLRVPAAYAEEVKTLRAEMSVGARSPSQQAATHVTPLEHALVCVLLGLAQHPYRAPEPDEAEVTVI